MDYTNIRLQLERQKAEDALAKAYPMSVQCCKCARVAYQPQAAHQLPHVAYIAMFRKGDFIHIKKEYNDCWWIGRIVGHESQMVFVPREAKLKEIIGDKISNVNPLSVYENAPIMRPIVFLGPTTYTSKKEERLAMFADDAIKLAHGRFYTRTGSQKEAMAAAHLVLEGNVATRDLTLLIQTPLISSMKDKFAGRLLSLQSAVQFGCEESLQKTTEALSVRQLEKQVYEAGKSLDLVYLVCPISCANDLVSGTKLHPLFVYIQVSRAKVLQKMILQTLATSREREELLDCAQQLSKNCHGYDLVISESNLEVACERLELFLESYWASTRSILLS